MLSEGSEISIHKSVRPYLKSELRVQYRTSVSWWQSTEIDSQRVHSSWSVTVFGCTMPFLSSPGKNVAVNLHTLHRARHAGKRHKVQADCPWLLG